MPNRFIRKAYRSVFPSKSEVGMNALFGRQSLGWTKLPKSLGFIKGKIFEGQFIFLPWFTYPAIAQLLRWNLKDQVVVEYGSGSSTMFFHEQGSKLVVSQEDKPEWFGFVNNSIPSSDKLVYKLIKDKNSYVFSLSALSEINPSIILIDGSYRADCAKSAFEYIKVAGVQDSPALIILDNSDWHGKSYSILSSLDEYLPIDFYGYGPYNSYTWCTTFFVNKGSSSANKLFSGSRIPATPMMNGLLASYSSDK
jgi:hypothetical protein